MNSRSQQTEVDTKFAEAYARARIALVEIQSLIDEAAQNQTPDWGDVGAMNETLKNLENARQTAALDFS